MEITIVVPDENKSALEERARARGCPNLSSYVEQLISTDLLAAKPFDEILAPIRKRFRENGISEADAEAMFEEAREEVYRKQRTRQ